MLKVNHLLPDLIKLIPIRLRLISHFTNASLFLENFRIVYPEKWRLSGESISRAMKSHWHGISISREW